MSTNNITLEFTPEALAAFHERERRRPCDSDQLSYATASASTVSDVIGPGRTLDKLLGAAGRLLERGCSTLVERLGRSPNALMANILQWMLRPQPDQCCARCSVTSKSAGSFTRSPPVPFEEIIHQLALLVPGLNGHCTCCLNRRRRQFVQRKDVRKGCKRLIRFLRDKNDSNKELAVLHIVILLAFFPDLCPIFVDLQVILVLENMIQDLAFRRRSNGLLAPSGRALALVSDATVLNTHRELCLIDEAVSGDDFWNPELRRGRDGFALSLVNLTKKPETKLLAAAVLTSTLQDTNLYSVHNSVFYTMTETSVYTWLQTVCNSDSLLSSVFTKLLYVVFLGVGTMSEPASRRWNYLWFPLLLSIKCEVETRIRARDCNTSLPPIYEQLLQLFIRSRIDCVSPAVQSKLLQYRHLVPMLKQYPILQPLSNSVEKLFSPWLLLQSRFRHEWSMYQYHHPIRRVVPMRELNTLCKSLLEWEMNNDDIVTMAREDPDIHELLLEFCGSAHSHTCELQDEIASSCRTCLLYNKLSCMEPRTLRIEVSIQNSRTCIGTAFGDELNSSLRIGRDGSSRTEGGVQYSLSTQDWPALRGSGGHAPEVCLTREGLIGDLASLRWLRLDEYSTRSSRYTPIVLSVDSDGLMQYVGSVVHHDVDGERISHDLLILDHDMKPDSLQVEGRDEDIDPEVYVLTIRTVPGHYIPPVYWVSKTHCLNCNQFHGDDYDQTRQYSIEGYDENGNEILTYPECRKPHLVEDGKIYSAVTLEELCISDGKFASGVSRVLSWYVPVLGPWAAPCSIG